MNNDYLTKFLLKKLIFCVVLVICLIILFFMTFGFATRSNNKKDILINENLNNEIYINEENTNERNNSSK